MDIGGYTEWSSVTYGDGKETYKKQYAIVNDKFSAENFHAENFPLDTSSYFGIQFVIGTLRR
jgi:hypothetical protein